MNYIYKGIRNLALAAAVLAGVSATAQTAITSDYNWYGSSGEQMYGWGTFGADHFYKQGTTRTPDNSHTVTVNGTNYPTYDLRDTSSDAVKFYLGQGAGTVKVYYNDAVTNVTRNITRSLRINDSNVSLNSATTRDGEEVNFPEAWGGNGITWSFAAAEQVKISSFTLNLPNNDIEGDIASVRIVLRFHDGVSEMDASKIYTGKAANQSITLNVDNEHRDAYLREIYIQNNSAGKIRVGTCTLQGTVTEPQKSSREVTTNLRPTDDNVQLYGSTTANGNTVLFGSGWTGLGWNISNTTTKLKRFTLTLDNSSIAENERGKVRVVVRYRNHGFEDESNPVNYLWSNEAANGNITLTVTPTAGAADYYIREIYIQNGNAGRINIASAELVTEVETEGSATPVLKKNQNENYSPLDYSDGQNGTKVLTYNFNNTENRNEFWIGGGQVGAIEVDFDESTVTTAPELSPITTDFLWYYNGGSGIYSAGYSNNNRLYRLLNGNPIGSSTTEICVNGITLDNDGGTNTSDKHSYSLAADQALGFKLDAGKKYRIRVLSDRQADTGDNPVNAVLYKGATASTSVPVKAENSVLVKTSTGVTTTTYLTTYEISNSGDTYWVRYPAGTLTLGGFEVLPIDNYSNDLSRKTIFPATQTSWWFDTYMEQGHTNECGSLNTMDLMKSGDNGPNVYVYGPDMPVHHLKIQDHRAVRINHGNRIGFRIPAGSRLTVQYAGDAGAAQLKVLHGATSDERKACSGGFDTFAYPADANTGTEDDEVVWITSSNANYIFISGFTITPIATASAPDPTVITDDYIWYSGETISASSRFGGDYLSNNGVGKRLLDDEQAKVDGRILGLYDYSRSSGSIKLQVAEGISGEIRVFWNKADLAAPESLDLSTNLPTYDWADFHNITSNNGQTITFDYTNNPTTDTEWPAAGYALTPSVGKYDRVTINLSENPGALYWHIVVLYDDGYMGDSRYTTGLTCTTDIDETRTLRAILIQGGIDRGQNKTITVGSVVLNRLGKGAGTLEDTKLYAGDTTSDPIGNTFTIEGTYVTTYAFSRDAERTYYIKGGFIAAVEVLKSNGIGWGDDRPTQSDFTAISAVPYSWKVEDALGTTINNGTDKMVLNGHTLANNGNILVYGDAYSETSHKFERDLVLNNTEVNGDKTVLMDIYHAIGVKLPAGGRYKVTAYWQQCDGKGSIAFLQRQNNKIYPRNHGDASVVGLQENGQSVYLVDLSSASSESVVWITAKDADPVYFSGFKIETYLDYSIVFDVNQPGIFTGKFKGAGDTEDKLLVYCTDNGTYESFRVPRVYYQDLTNTSTPLTELTTNPSTTINVTPSDFEIDGATNCKTPTIAADDMIGDKPVYKVVGFEDTDNDRIWKMTYSYTRKYTEDGEDKSETYSDYYYIWYANYLKIGWWTNREAKLIVGSNDSGADPDHIIVGEFYISSGETADFYYDVINPGKDTSGNTVHGYANAIFTEAEWTYTLDKEGTTNTKHRAFSPTATEKKSNNVDPEEFSWTKMNDHKNHTGDAISLAYPVAYNAADWSSTGGEVVKTVSFSAKRAGWPDWTARLTFHYVLAPSISVASTSTSHKTIAMTAATRLADETTDGKIYYTTDGTNPTTINGKPTNQTYVYNASAQPTNYQTTIYYAAERVTKPKQFYIHNPFTTHIEDETMYTLMENASNKSNTFLAVTKEFEAPVVDPMVEYVDEDRNIVSKSRTNVVTSTTSYNVWGTDVGTHSQSALGVGGFLYKYPMSQQYRDVMVLFGNSDTKVYRENVFKNVGVYFGSDDNDAFGEHFDFALYKWKTMGYNYDSSHGGSSESQNGNPQTECNGGIGSEKTEQGGLWLAPIAGDFLRFEPEYDGVITVWLRTNGAAQGDEYYGDITRRPVYVVDENGKVMKRSTVKPTQDNYFGIDGLYAEICTNRSTVRHDCRTDWVNGLASWKSGFKHDADEGLPWRNMATFRLYNYWYGFPLFQNKNREHHTPRGIPQNETNGNHYRFSMDVADSWVSRTANVKSVQCEFNSIVYHSEQLHNDIEKNDDIKFVHGDGDNYKDGNIYSGDKFALYGWELPSYNVVRYRFPVKAGKSYYIGGRGTKNGYMGMKFEPLPANYKPSDYVTTAYRKLYEDDTKVTVNSSEVDVDAFTAYDHISADGSKAMAYNAYSRNLATYTNTTDMGADNPTFNDANYPNIPTYDLWEESPSGKFNSWYGQQGVNGSANVLFQNFTTTYWGNGQYALVNENSVVGHTCNVRLYRQFTKGYWHPIVLPFSVSESRMKEIFGDEVQVLYLDPYENVMKSKNNTSGLGSNGQKGDWVSALNPAISYENLRFTYHHYQMLYANVPAFICPGGRRKVNGAWTTNWSTIGTSTNTDKDGALLFERVTVDRSNLTDNDYDKIGYKIGETGNWEYWVTGSYTPGMKGATDGVYYLTNELTDQDGEQKMRAVIYHSPNGKTLKATRCWIAVRKKNAGHDIPYGQPPLLTNVSFTDFQGDDLNIYDVPSGIGEVIMDEAPEGGYTDDNVYDILGRIVGHGSTDDLPAGVYVFHGRKIYVR